MSAACGGLISFSIISTVVIVLGIVIAVVKQKSNKVTQDPNEYPRHYGPIW
jgi:hypothetical protein